MTSADTPILHLTRSAAHAALFLLAAACAGCKAKGPELVHFSGPTMGTSYNVKIVGRYRAEEREAIKKDIDAVLEHIESLMSTYRPDSELSRFNAKQDTEWFPISKETRQCFLVALDAAFKTSGAFDPTVGPLVNAWGFGPDSPAADPTLEEISILRQRVGWDKLELNEEKGIRKTRPDMYCDLSGVAQGFAADAVAEMLSERGIADYMIDVSGEIIARGKNLEGNPWQIAIEKPEPGGRAIQRVIALENRAMATSGDYRNFREKDGKRISHEIDPRTGRPIDHELVSVTVVHDVCAFADAFATGFMVLGPRSAYNFAASYRLPVLFILSDGRGGFVEQPTPMMELILQGKAPEAQP